LHGEETGKAGKVVAGGARAETNEGEGKVQKLSFKPSERFSERKVCWLSVIGAKTTTNN